MLVGPINSRPSKKHWIGWKEVSEKAMAGPTGGPTSCPLNQSIEIHWIWRLGHPQ